MAGESLPVAVFSVSPDMASIDRDRDITSQLISTAGDLVCHGVECKVDEKTLDKANEFLREWFDRKRPKLDMPGGMS